MKAIAVLIIALLFAGCQQSNSEIALSRQWKADTNNLIGDFITFSKEKNKGLYIEKDIYFDGKPKALLISTSYYVDHYFMIVNSIDHKTSARYVDKGRAK